MPVTKTFKYGWFLLKAKPREELRAQSNLDHQGFDTYCPQVLDGGNAVALFPGYLFIHLLSKDIPSYHKIRSTRGITEIVHFKRMNRNLYGAGKLTQEKVNSLLPSPIPNGDNLIEQIKAFVVEHNNATETSSSSEGFNEGERVLLNQPLFGHLESTFVKGINMDRGLILIEFIEKMQTDEGVEEQVVAQKELTVALKDLRKIPEEH